MNASRAVGVAAGVMSAEGKAGYVSDLRGEYVKLPRHMPAARRQGQAATHGGAQQCAQARLVGALMCRRADILAPKCFDIIRLPNWSITSTGRRSLRTWN